MKFSVKDIVTISGAGRTAEWEKDLEGTVSRIDKKKGLVFVIWHGISVEDEMKPEELVKIGVNISKKLINILMSHLSLIF